ncbi:MAG: hypothetical protein HONDAALG_00723 [Gammaproteobacteria bacterium]|nr:hypothetical protein [Gammaproteobacteria bacterium]
MTTQTAAPGRLKDLQAIRDFIYTPLGEAVRLLEERQALPIHPDLDREGMLDVPPIMRQKRAAILFRQVATPNHEMHLAMSLARQFDLNLIIWEYHADQFVSLNHCKRALGRMGFFSGIGRNGGRRMDYLNIVDFPRVDGQPLGEVRTLWGQPLADFHHELLSEDFPESARTGLFDATAWLERHGGRARHYYKAFTMLLIRHAILLETFEMSGKELQFTEEIFIPAMRDIISAFEVKPLVARIEEVDVEGDEYWLNYPGRLRNRVRGLLPRRPHIRSIA